MFLCLYICTDTALKTEVSSGQIQAPPLGSSGNFIGMQRRSTPVFVNNPPNISAGVNLNQFKEPGFTQNQQKVPSFNLTTAQSAAGTSLVSGKFPGFSNVPASKPPSGSLPSNKPVIATGAISDAKPPGKQFGS